jgi:hypothetical protein
MLAKEEQEKLKAGGHVKYKGEIFSVEAIRDLRIHSGDPVRHVFIDIQAGVPIDDDDLTLPTVEEVEAHTQKSLEQRW